MDSSSAPVAIGEKVASFYITYRDANTDISALAEILFHLETHQPISDVGETADIVSEIVTDCQKKSAQTIRAPYAESVRNIISTIRKKLASKVALDDQANSQQHGQRHLSFLVELLGSWSNIISEISRFGLSRTTLRLTISPLHARIIEMAFECFEKFKGDKNLESWHMKMVELASGMHSSTTTADAGFSILTLDFLISQMSAMREIVRQYYGFVSQVLANAPDFAMWNGSSASQAEGYDPNNSTTTDVSNILDDTASVAAQIELLCSTSERNRWRELDAMYISLEFGYLSWSVQEALSDRALLEIEGNTEKRQKDPINTGDTSASSRGDRDRDPSRDKEGSLLDRNGSMKSSVGALAPQAVEDVFFLFQKTAERALSTGSDDSAFAVGNKIIELLDPLRSDMHEETITTISGIQIPKSLYRLLQKKIVYRGCCRANMVNCRARVGAALNGPAASNKAGGSLPRPGSSQALTGASTNINNSSANNSSGLSGESAGSASVSGKLQLSLSSLNGWFKALEEIAAPLPEGVPNASGATGADTGTGVSMGGPPKSTGNAFDDLLSALESDVDGGAGAGGDGQMMGFQDSIEDEMTPLHPVDAAVQLNALALVPTAVLSLVDTFARACDAMEIHLDGHQKKLLIVSQELTRCSVIYHCVLSDAARDLARMLFDQHLSVPLNNILRSNVSAGAGAGAGGNSSIASGRNRQSNYEIDGETMERRAGSGGDNDLVRAVRVLLASSIESSNARSPFSAAAAVGGEQDGSSVSSTGETEGSGADGGGVGLIAGLGYLTGLTDSKPHDWDALRAAASAGELLSRRLSSPARNEVLLQLAAMLAEAILCTISGPFHSIPPSGVSAGATGATGATGAHGESNLPSPSSSASGDSASVASPSPRAQSNTPLVTFTEWGALLLQREIMSISRAFVDATEDDARSSSEKTALNDPRVSAGAGIGAGAAGGRGGMAPHGNGQPKDARLLVKDAFSGLTWAMKVLTLDQPADIRRYFIPCAGTSNSPQTSATRTTGTGSNSNSSSGVSRNSTSNSSSGGGVGAVTKLSEDRVRRLLCSRVEFSRDAAMKVKINFL